MKIQIKIPNQPNWPDQYCGKIVWVDVESVKFPDGLYWTCSGFDAELVDQSKQSQFFHELPVNTKRVSVEYFTPKEMQQ
jgi:hypothetical protein